MKIIFITMLMLVALINSEILVHKVPSTQEEILKYWTKERMLKAKPMPLLKINKNASPEELENQKKWLDEQKQIDELYKQFLGIPPKQQQSYHIPPKRTEYVPTQDYGNMPFAQSGKLFFRNSRTHEDGVCSGSVVGANVILTAGHCVSDGRGAYHYNFNFVPQFMNGQTPKGRFSGRSVLTFDSWHVRENQARDLGLVIVGNNHQGRTPQQVVGSLGIQINLPRNQACVAIGYPLNFARGQMMIRSYGNQMMGHNRLVPPTVKFPSTMTQGSSGGPVVITHGPAANSVNGNVAYGDPVRDPYHFYSPYYDSEVLSLYSRAQTVSKNLK